jgi:hypothetical protein
LQASAETDPEPLPYGGLQIGDQSSTKAFLRRGDHSKEMESNRLELTEARKYAITANKEIALSYLIDFFRTGDYKVTFRNALKHGQKIKHLELSILRVSCSSTVTLVVQELTG